MKSAYTTFTGVDVSKNTLDFCIYDGVTFIHHCIANNAVGIKNLFKSEPALGRWKLKKMLFCIENTGYYQNHLVNFLSAHKTNFTVQSPLHIKYSMGLVRGKSDKIDAKRIAIFASKNAQSLPLYQPPREVLLALKHLLSLRTRLVMLRNSLRVPLTDNSAFVAPAIHTMVKGACAGTIEAANQDIISLELKMLSLMREDERLARLYKIVTSVRGVGQLVATNMLVLTNEFKNFETAAKFASYIGIAPFSRTSGTSVQQNPHISKYGHKGIKALLFVSLLSVLKYKGPERAYFDRKKNEGKHAYVILNAMKNKLVKQIFACVREDRLAEERN